MTEVAMLLGATDRNRTREKVKEIYRFEQQIAKVYRIKFINIAGKIDIYFVSQMIDC